MFATLLAVLPLTQLPPAKPSPGLCVYHYRVSTPSAECQAFVDQGLAYFDSYVWMEAARSFETALRHDPDCAFAWLGLHNALAKWDKAPKSVHAALGGAAAPQRGKDYALAKAQQLLKQCSHREGFLIKAKLQEVDTALPEADRKKKAAATLDEMLALYDDDQEGWFARALIAEAPIPWHKALLRINPLHPGANHELVHAYENLKRPALGWPHAEKYMESSPGIPHALHMQAHLATRIGKWQHTSDWSTTAIELEKAYHKTLSVKPSEDHQYSHHLETLTRSLVHDGRFAEAQEVRKEAEKNKYHYRPEWIRMAMMTGDVADAKKLIEEMRRTDKNQAAYFGALLALSQKDITKAKAEYEVLRQSKPSKKDDKKSEPRQWEVQGRILCAGGDEAGLKLLRRAVDKTKDDYSHHAWGNGASLMEAWGEAALACGRYDEAEEAFQEALAHDAGSVKGALGMAAVFEHAGRDATGYWKLAKKCWNRATEKDYERLKQQF